MGQRWLTQILNDKLKGVLLSSKKKGRTTYHWWPFRAAIDTIPLLKWPHLSPYRATRMELLILG